MTGTKGLYAMTLGLAGLAGFSTGWTVRPAEVRAVVSFKEKYLMEADQSWRITAGERDRLERILDDYDRALKTLRDEFDANYGAQVTAVQDEYNALLGAILTQEKRR